VMRHCTRLGQLVRIVAGMIGHFGHGTRAYTPVHRRARAQARARSPRLTAPLADAAAQEQSRQIDSAIHANASVSKKIRCQQLSNNQPSILAKVTRPSLSQYRALFVREAVVKWIGQE
jgi:hypothetical protein